MHRILTKEESENADRTLNEWWEKLEFNAKIHFRNLVESVKNPTDPDLPVFYEEEQPPVQTYTISSCSCTFCVVCNTGAVNSQLCHKVAEHWNMHVACCGCSRDLITIKAVTDNAGYCKIRQDNQPCSHVECHPGL